MALIEPEEAKLVRSFAVNRFRGDPALFHDGRRILEDKASRPCLGVFPYVHDLHIDEEDGVALDYLAPAPQDGPRIAILRFPRISKLTDFQLLRWADWIQSANDASYDIVILPGTKNPVADLAWMRSRGLDEWVRRQHEIGAVVLGICGGYQILGERIDDPFAVESGDGSVEGLGLLPVTTVLEREKVTQVVKGATPGGVRFPAYEIHMGKTTRPAGSSPFAYVEGREEGLRAGRCWGTYLHGALESVAVIGELFGVELPPVASKDFRYDRLADWFEESADTKLFEDLYL